MAEPFGLTLTFIWDALGRRTKVEDSLGGVTTSTYDVLGQLTKREFGGSGQTPLRIDLTYTVEGQQESLTRYSDLAGTTKVATSSYTNDAAQRLANLPHFDGSNTNIANYTYTYDAQSRLTNINRNGTVTTYTYDDTDQLTADGTNTFTYDAEGNRTNTGYTTGTGNRLTSDGTWNYTYDDEGNMTKKVKISNGLTWTYGYDHRNQLSEVQHRTTDGGTLEADVDIQYDAYGNRLIKIVDENGDGDVDYRERYGLDGWNTAKPSPIGNENWDVWADLNGGYNLQTRYLRGDVVDQLFARIKNNGDAFWYFGDHLGSIRDITNNSGVVKDSLTYDGFGNITAETDPAFRGRYAWTGREYDTEIDLQYNRARYYDAATGRWISEDPLGFEAGDGNLYRYLQNSPANSYDPSGFVELETTFGKWDFQLGWQATTQPEPGTNKPIPARTAIAKIWFYPKQVQPVFCEKLGFIQIIQLKDSKNMIATDFEIKPGVKNNMAGRMTNQGWAIDRRPAYVYPWYGMGNNGQTIIDFSRLFDPNNIKQPSAYMRDMATTTGFQVTTYEFETYVIGFSLKGGGLVYSGLRWGFTLKPNGPVTKATKVVQSPITPINSMSKNFMDAVAAWNQQQMNNPIPKKQQPIIPFINAPAID